MNPHIFGIRHHGPGSAKSLLNALKEIQPDLILVEGPPEADALIPDLENEELKPPVAMLLYNPKDLSQAAYFPFADFSPEWQTIKFALNASIPVQFMDLPQGIHFGLDITEKENIQLRVLPESEEEIEHGILTPKEQQQLYKDPLGFMAQLAGYADSERWWEITFEQQENEQTIFPALLEMMTALREEIKHPLPRRELLREAYMRKIIREAIKNGNEKIVVVCGAWHAPALHAVHQIKTTTDNKILKGLKKIKPKVTWTPWTYDRLSFHSGYRAGVISPAWYQLLFHERENVVILWMTKVAQLLRSEDLDASSAHVIEAVRLANTLSTIRGLPVPGIGELEEAVITIFCDGDSSRFDLIAEKLIIGDQMGKVPEDIPQIPLQADLTKRIQSAYLKKERNTTEVKNKELDLRKPTHRKASHLLHQLNLLKIHWGQRLKVVKSGNAGAFHERWRLQWQPDFAIHIVEAGMWGNTVYNAATNKVISDAETLYELPGLTQLIENALNADLKSTFEILIHRLQDISVITRDTIQLMMAVPPLIRTLRYGSTREIDLETLLEVIHQLIPRICITLPNTCIGVNEEVSENIFDQILLINSSISLLTNKDLEKQWFATLEQIANMSNVNKMLSGACTRILFDKEIFTLDQTATKMRYALAEANEPLNTALWLQGFLHGSGLLLIHVPRLWNILDSWMDEIGMLKFMNMLPLLRRTFSAFSQPERQKMMMLAKKGKQKDNQKSKDNALNEERAAVILPTVKMLLGIK